MAPDAFRMATLRVCLPTHRFPCVGRQIRLAFRPGAQRSLPDARPAVLLQSLFAGWKSTELAFKPPSLKRQEVDPHCNGCYTEDRQAERGCDLFSPCTRDINFLPRTSPEQRDAACRFILFSPKNRLGSSFHSLWRETKKTGHRYKCAAAQKREADLCGCTPRELQAEGHCSFVSSEKRKPNFRAEDFVNMRGEDVFFSFLPLEDQGLEIRPSFGFISSLRTEERRNCNVPFSAPYVCEQVFAVNTRLFKKKTDDRENFIPLDSSESTGEFRIGSVSRPRHPLCFLTSSSSTEAQWGSDSCTRMQAFPEKSNGVGGSCFAASLQSAVCVPCHISDQQGQRINSAEGHEKEDGRMARTNSGAIRCSDRKRKIMNGTEYIRRKTGHRGRIKRNSQAPAYKRK